jgi:hypothetical protein
LHSSKTDIEHSCDAFHGKRFGHSWYTLDQCVTTAKDGGKAQIDELLLTNDDLGQLAANVTYEGCETL